MSNPFFDQPDDLWLVDGSLRDVYIQAASPEDWRALLKLTREHVHEYARDGVVQELPELVAIFADREHSHLLRIEVAAVKIHCHFFVPDEIELDIDPREVVGPREHSAVLDFLERLSGATRKSVRLTSENSPESVLLSYEPAQSIWHIHNSGGESDA